jgi:hypothetical protein
MRGCQRCADGHATAFAQLFEQVRLGAKHLRVQWHRCVVARLLVSAPTIVGVRDSRNSKGPAVTRSLRVGASDGERRSLLFSRR